MFRLIAFLFLVFAINLVPVIHASAASFDCGKAVTQTEKAICGDPNLSALDEEMAQLWSSQPRNSVEMRQQRNWLEYRDALSQSTSCVQRFNRCLSQPYEYRILELISGCEIGIVPPLWDDDFSIEELETVLGISAEFEECRMKKLKNFTQDFEAVSDFLKILPVENCAISFDVFLYPISERRGHYVMSRCSTNTVKSYEILLDATLKLIGSRNDTLIEKIALDTQKWTSFAGSACEFHTEAFVNTPYMNSAGIDKCRAELLKFRILYLSPLIGIDEFYGYPANSIDELLGEYYGEYRR